ncbi:type 1 glutamine amidotransferase [Albimonas sp. CAU 1670]|uniref:type 1 glutamine amidotransferase n=1 Tax=Albimonas sp. CAU 1670 TaxID=3032599 RepID=UPI0023DCCF47|nr:type 1 glutamine amidotransferase [Albimonas sp. CAU 1670]MDF2232340.1 type 1 glutamine amidotransferase [Albimonas sp. CAU 1670]
MARTIHILEHMDLPGPDAGLSHLRARGAHAQVHHAWKGEALPALEGADGLIVMGGPQMVTDIADLPWMQAEIELMRQALARGVPMLCICLGAQMLAHALGAAVGPDPDGRIAWGYHPVRALPAADNPIPDGLTVLSGNFQGFSRPAGVEMLATAEGPWANQAFRTGRALATQFHPEVTFPILQDWQSHLAPHVHKPGATSVERQDADFARHDPALKDWYRGLLDRWFALA